jgi:hypothetical protein
MPERCSGRSDADGANNTHPNLVWVGIIGALHLLLPYPGSFKYFAALRLVLPLAWLMPGVCPRLLPKQLFRMPSNPWNSLPKLL